ncbi:MAG: hypothetical protein NZ561_04145 [Phycisphaerae bacterium]|nr:hypothetical protein [Phycisphaerae bacterium]
MNDADTFHATVRFEADSPLPKPGPITLFAEHRGKFHKQNCRILATKTAGSSVIVNLERFGDPEPVENDVEIHIHVAAQQIAISVDKQINCPLEEIAEEGLTVIPQQPLQVGTEVEVKFSIDSIYGTGSLKVEAARKLADGRTAYSLVVPNRKSPILKSIEALRNILHRRQMRRLAA